MTVFQMYYENDKKVGFWITRNSWGKTLARIVSIASMTSGELVGLGRYPYFNDAKEKVKAEFFKIVRRDESGLFIEQIMPVFNICSDDDKLAMVSCPNTYSYGMLDFSQTQVFVKSLGANDFLRL